MELEFFITSQANSPETLSHRESRELCKTIELIYIAYDHISNMTDTSLGHTCTSALLHDVNTSLRLPITCHGISEIQLILATGLTKRYWMGDTVFSVEKTQHPTCCPSRKRKLGDCERGATSGNRRDQRQKRSDLSRTPSSGNTVHSARKQNQQCVPEEQRPDPQPVVEGTAADKVGELPFHAVMQPSSTGSEISAFDYSVNSVADPSSIHSSYIGPSGSIFDYSVDSMADPSSIHSSYIGPSGPIFDYSVDSMADPSSIHSSSIRPSGSTFDYSIDFLTNPCSAPSRFVFDYRISSLLDPQAAQQYATFNYGVDSSADSYLSTCFSEQCAPP
ncbi:predicted protein [Histoplasma mississippiense (nom. inval.)]|uniref:predicted protein n=1 Tax=Ajellomyces capsulatus (strain NAm1 / WU24) TaxID=2059318 RepID=UPI000157D317|nr:predicted protein [Histoplasma mississippiense (nom. inval.)]EDN04907.1 predicted protein [Histoplasma mississippiense (nom. inval.)]